MAESDERTIMQRLRHQPSTGMCRLQHALLLTYLPSGGAYGTALSKTNPVSLTNPNSELECEHHVVQPAKPKDNTECKLNATPL